MEKRLLWLSRMCSLLGIKSQHAQESYYVVFIAPTYPCMMIFIHISIKMLTIAHVTLHQVQEQRLLFKDLYCSTAVTIIVATTGVTCGALTSIRYRVKGFISLSHSKSRDDS
jgi:hypothetical protein